MLQDYEAKLSDFGLAKDGPEGDKTHVSTRVMGTYGYAAPEYVMTGRFILVRTSPCIFNQAIDYFLLMPLIFHSILAFFFPK